MYFKKLEIFGFKSFADKTALNFEPGITAIIGPNGCGKSNVFDAIRWVLGEQSIKELRGSSMEDVIFNGTDKKPGLGFAEVSLTFSNESRMLPVEYNEVTITRRLFRSGESEYLLNKTTVRLKDIVELCMGTGIGAEAYSLVQQGKVDLVVSAKPEERRVILDEASGITKYKAKRKEALNKLKDTDNNLLRINDIITEVKRQISSLERQANKARRYKEEYEKLKKLEVFLANQQLAVSLEQRNSLNKQLFEMKQQESRHINELDEWKKNISSKNNILNEVETKINAVKEEHIKLEGKMDIHNRQIGFNNERIDNIALNKERLTKNKIQLKEKCDFHTNKIKEVSEHLSSIDQVFQNKLELLENNDQTLANIVKIIKESSKIIKEKENSILSITSRQVHIKNNLTEIMKEVQGCLARKRRLEMEFTKVGREKQQVDQKLNEICQKSDIAVGQISELKNKLESKKKILDELTEELMSLEKFIDNLEKQKLFLISQKDFIEKLRVQYQGIPDPVVEGRLLTRTPPLKHHSGIIGKVKEVIPTQDNQMYEIISEIKFIELDPQQISLKINGLTEEIEHKTLEKDVVLKRVAEQKSITGKVEQEIQEQEKIFSIYESQRKNTLEEANKLIQEIDLVKMELDEVAGSLDSCKTKETHLVQQLDVFNKELEVSQIAIKDSQDLIASKSKEREKTTISIAQLKTETASLKDKKASHEDNLKMFSDNLESGFLEIDRIEKEFSDLDQRKIQLVKDIEVLKQGIADLKVKKDSLRTVLAEYESQKDTIFKEMNCIRKEMSSHAEKIEEIKNQIHDQQLHEQELSFKEKEIKDRLMQSYKIDLEEYNRKEQENQNTEQQEDKESSKGIDPKKQDLMTELNRLRKRCDSFGSVNLVAIEEFEELRERFEFLTKQQSDLISAKESLHQTIRKINRQTRQMFMDTFTKVSEEFRIYFRMLFGGGDGQLVLLDPENVLESGIDIIARPPGKKLQNISLLSGGEKTLTAIALIFGVFKVNPSPFCVLDEIDAALDESNVGRFSYLLKDFAKIAQFIVITHNKKTIESANVMYGITMQETGVSKIVSVKLGDNNQEKKAGSQEKIPVGV